MRVNIWQARHRRGKCGRVAGADDFAKVINQILLPMLRERIRMVANSIFSSDSEMLYRSLAQFQNKNTCEQLVAYQHL